MVFINGAFLSLGMLITWHKEISHQQQWMNNYYTGKEYISATLEEPLSEKTNSYKATASVQVLVNDKNILPVKGNIIIYFKKILLQNC